MREIVIKTIFGDDRGVARLSPFIGGYFIFQQYSIKFKGGGISWARKKIPVLATLK
jgi:hypothetical protein